MDKLDTKIEKQILEVQEILFLILKNKKNRKWYDLIDNSINQQKQIYKETNKLEELIWQNTRTKHGDHLYSNHKVVMPWF